MNNLKKLPTNGHYSLPSGQVKELHGRLVKLFECAPSERETTGNAKSLVKRSTKIPAWWK
jgi:hypothetical protein